MRGAGRESGIENAGRKIGRREFADKLDGRRGYGGRGGDCRGGGESRIRRGVGKSRREYGKRRREYGKRGRQSG